MENTKTGDSVIVYFTTRDNPVRYFFCAHFNGRDYWTYLPEKPGIAFSALGCVLHVKDFWQGD